MIFYLLSKAVGASDSNYKIIPVSNVIDTFKVWVVRVIPWLSSEDLADGFPLLDVACLIGLFHLSPSFVVPVVFPAGFYVIVLRHEIVHKAV